METTLLTISQQSPEAERVQQAAKLLQQGGLVAIPTETVYGLGANGLDPLACKQIYVAKGRPSDNPLILHIATAEQLYPLVASITPQAHALMQAFWPGPLTLIFEKSDLVPLEATGGLSTVALRMPSHPIARAIIEASGLAVAAPSANSSGRPSPTRASHVQYDLGGKIDMIVDGGPAEWGLESTIVDVSGESALILRPGSITKEQIEAVLGTEVSIDPALSGTLSEEQLPKAPGMKYAHYAPNAKLHLVFGSQEATQRTICDLIASGKQEGLRVGVLATTQTKEAYSAASAVLSLGSAEDMQEIGTNLYKALRHCDFLELDVVYCAAFSEEGDGLAIMNRLKKAAAYRFIQAN